MPIRQQDMTRMLENLKEPPNGKTDLSQQITYFIKEFRNMKLQ